MRIGALNRNGNIPKKTVFRDREEQKRVYRGNKKKEDLISLSNGRRVICYENNQMVSDTQL